MKAVASLVAGSKPVESGDFSDSMAVLYENIDELSTIVLYVIRDGASSRHYRAACYFGRALLESSYMSILGRIDPVRLLCVRGFQKNGYDLNLQYESSIRWTGDILPTDTPHPQSMWSANVKSSSISRAVFSKYTDSLIWQFAAQNLLDDYDIDFDLIHLLRREGAHRFNDIVSGQSKQAYSMLSKGIHAELVFRPSIYFDETTIKEQLRRVVTLVSVAGLVSHFSEVCHRRITETQAVRYAKQIGERIND
jgi:hypothetical protein